MTMAPAHQLRPGQLAQRPQLLVVRNPPADTALDMSVLDDGERQRAMALRRPGERAELARNTPESRSVAFAR